MNELKDNTDIFVLSSESKYIQLLSCLFLLQKKIWKNIKADAHMEMNHFLCRKSPGNRNFNKGFIGIAVIF